MTQRPDGPTDLQDRLRAASRNGLAREVCEHAIIEIEDLRAEITRLRGLLMSTGLCEACRGNPMVQTCQPWCREAEKLRKESRQATNP